MVKEAGILPVTSVKLVWIRPPFACLEKETYIFYLLKTYLAFIILNERIVKKQRKERTG
jgi:hypothetical protein